MSRQKRTAEHIIDKLLEAEALPAKRIPMEEVMWQLGVSDAACHE